MFRVIQSVRALLLGVFSSSLTLLDVLKRSELSFVCYQLRLLVCSV